MKQVTYISLTTKSKHTINVNEQELKEMMEYRYIIILDIVEVI